MTLAIIGTGKIGRWFAEFFLKEGESVIVSDKDEKTLAIVGKELEVETADNTEAVRRADRVLICVPMEELEDVVREIRSFVRPDQVVMDVCSIKTVPVEVMHKYIKKGTVLGTHPVFGPGVKSIVNQNFILTPIKRKEEQFAREFRVWLERRQAKVSIMSPRKHDELMSVVLGLPHFIGLAVCETLLDCTDFLEMEKVAGPSYKMLLMFAKAVASEQTRFYTSLQMNLPETSRIESLFLKKSREWLSLTRQKDTKSFARKMDFLKTRLGRLDSDYTAAYEAMHKLLEISGE